MQRANGVWLCIGFADHVSNMSRLLRHQHGRSNSGRIRLLREFDEVRVDVVERPAKKAREQSRSDRRRWI